MERDVTSLPPLEAGERIGYGSDNSQFFDLWRSTGPMTLGAAVMIHGGFWRSRYDLRHASHICAALARSGVFTANVEYRRVGQQGGGWPGSFEDVVAGINTASRYLGSLPIIIGHSAGGHLALRVASEPIELRAVVALAPVADLQMAFELNLSNGAVAEFLDGTPTTKPNDYRAACPSQYSASVPRILIHGTQDDVVPISIARAFVEARQNDSVPPSLVEIPEAGHMDLVDPESRAWPIALDKVLSLLQK